MKFPYIYGENVEKSYPSVKVSIELITPEQASEMLRANVKNRAMKREPIVDALAEGYWTLNGATIVFSDDGVLLDGQNRLYACAQSGIPMVTIVVRGIRADAQVSMDSGIKRTVADYLSMLGYQDAKALQAVGNALIKKDENGFLSVINNYKASYPNGKVVSFIIGNIDRVTNYKNMSNRIARKFPRIRKGILAAVLEELYRASEEDADAFVRQLMGEDNPCQPVEILRQSLANNSTRREGGLPQKHVMALIVKAWNAYMRGEVIGVLRYRTGGAHPEEFPEVCRPMF